MAAFRSAFDAGEMRTELEKAGIKPTFIPFIWKHLLHNPNNLFNHNLASEFEWEHAVPSLPSAAYSLLRSKFKPLTSTVHSVIDSSDQVTTKLLIKLQSGAFVEAVIMRYDTRLGKYGGQPRPGVCGLLSVFLHRLAAKWAADSVQPELWDIKGMGEPLNNYTALVEAVRAMTGSPFLLSPKRITISTVGIIHAINKLHGDLPGLNLAVSLHAPVQDIRCQIMPAARAFPLQKLMDALQEYQKKSQQKILIEYIMLDGVNDEEQHAHQLGKLLETFQVVVNLIPFNPIGSSSQFRTSSDEKVSTFQKVLRGTYNIRTTVRKQMGQDISGACGQLVVSLPNKSSGKQTSVLPDIEDLHL